MIFILIYITISGWGGEMTKTEVASYSSFQECERQRKAVPIKMSNTYYICTEQAKK
jgi:hypothetical protein